LWGLFNCQTFKPYIQQLAGGSSGSMPNISKGRLKGLKIPIPNNSMQAKFSKIVTKIEEQKALVKKARDETQYLFDSLMSQYFE
jgi:type I restriction enzyme S subunit